MEEKQLKVVMYPWLAMGHITPYFQLAMNFAERGHKVTLLLPNKAKLKLPSSNLHPSLLILHGITVPQVDPLPLGTELNSEIPLDLEHHLATAFDRVRPQFESIISTFEPNIVFYDFAHWVPDAVVASKSRAKCVNYCAVSAVALSLCLIPFREPPKDRPPVEEDMCVAGVPPGFPSSTVVHDPKGMLYFMYKPFGEGVTFYQRITTAIKGSDVIVIRTCREIEGKYCDFLSTQYNNKPVLVSGPVLLEQNTTELETRWDQWLNRFGHGSVVFCAFGSQVILDVAQFQEILVGIENTNLPFLIALKPPKGYTSVEEAFPKGFAEKNKDRGLVTGEWIPQQQILNHPSIGCFVNHCGSGSIWESLLSKNQIVLIPQMGDQVLFSQIITQELKVAVQVERGEDGLWISRESLCHAIKSVMDQDSGIRDLVRENHENWRQKFTESKLMTVYVDNLIKDLKALIHG